MYEYVKDLTNKIGAKFDKNKFNFLMDYYKIIKEPGYMINSILNDNCEMFIKFISAIRDVIKSNYLNISQKNETNLLNLSLYFNTSKISYEILKITL